MPALADKLTIEHGLLTDIEVSYGGGGSPAGATDAVLIEEAFEVQLQYAHDGARSPFLGAGGLLGRSAPAGRHGTFTVPILGKGLGSAYTLGTDEVPDLQDLIRMCGHDATRSGTTPNTLWTFEPNTSNTDSGVLEGYTRGEKYVATGAMGSMNFKLDSQGWMFSFELGASFAIPVEAAVPALTVDTTTIPPKGEAITLDLHGETGLVVESIEFSMNRNLANRTNINAASGHEGFQGTKRAPQVVIKMEQPLFAKLNLYSIHEAATAGNLSFQVANGTGNKIRLDANQAVIAESPALDETDDVAMVSLTLDLAQTAPGADDDYDLIFDE